jgi:chromosome partitioning protein
MILTFATSKGGAGKSTTCACISAELAVRGSRVLVMDLDPNRTLDLWARQFPIEGLTVTTVDRDRFSDHVREERASGAYDHICIDLPGTREATLIKALGRSDLVIIPAQPSKPDLREALRVVGDIRDIREETGKSIPFRLLLTKVFPLRARATEFAYAELAQRGLPLFHTAMVERSAYRDIFLNGQLPSQTDRDKAGAEVQALLCEIQQILAPEDAEYRRAG